MVQKTNIKVNNPKVIDFFYFADIMRLSYNLKGGDFGLMTTVKVGDNESVESALKRFKRKCQKDGIIGDIRRKEAYHKPSVAKKLKREAARKKARKHQ